MTDQTQPRKRSKWKVGGIGCLGVVALVVIIGVAASLGGGDAPTSTTVQASPSTSSTWGSKPGQDKATAAGIGDTVKDGDFDFTVTKVEAGPKVIGTADFGAKPQGKFVLVHVKVTNHGDQAGTFFGDNQKLKDQKGREFSADSEAAIYLDDAQSLLEEINPGNTLTGVVIFDVAPDATPTSLELHDSAFSGGVTVNLT